VRQLVPALGTDQREWLDGVTTLADPVAFPSFVASRLAYRRLARHLKWLAVPLLLAVALKLPLALLWAPTRVSAWSHRLIVVGVALLADLVLVSAAILAAARQAWEAMAASTAQQRGQAQNDAPRDEARALVRDGWAGFITGHTHHAELTPVLDGFYANTGCSMQVVDERPTHTGLPPVFLPSRTTSWIELEAAADVHARLFYGRAQLPGATRLERMAAKAPPIPDGRPVVLASFPDGASWPAASNDAVRLRGIRRRAAAGVALIALVDIGSAVTPPLANRLRVVRSVMPLGIPQAAAALAALAGIALLLLALAVSHGGRRAWRVSLGLLGGSAALHVLKGFDLEEAALAAAAAGYLWVHRRAFRAAPAPQTARTSLRIVAAAAGLATAAGTAAIELFAEGRPRLPLPRAVVAAAERLVGLTTIHLPDRVDDVLAPVLAAVGFTTVVVTGWLLFRPAMPRRPADAAADRSRARDLVDRYGDDSLAYFALRDDKEIFFWADSMVAYAVVGGVCLVSPDPIGPVAEREATWAAFYHFALEHGWSVAVMGATEEWLPVYRAAGMHDIYVGDEAIVDCTRFSLEGGKAKGLRQAVNRIARNGYRAEFFDPAHLDPGLRAQLQALMAESRRGDVERGFSMTLSRIFDPGDRHLLLTVAFGPDGRPVAFCQWVPAPGIDGYSLDLMRRSIGEHPNGLLDFVVVETIRHLAQRGMRGLALNFATMRAVLAGETGSGPTQRVERWLLQRMSESMQIDSLWKYNAKFSPDWKPRYAVYDSPQEIVAAALAVAKAESFWELPIVGRFLVPDQESPPAPAA
jgi:lysylphosphatidylglycerol synthetase-like protein (DUF2156 family)